MRIEIAEQPEALSNTFDALLAQVGELAALGRDTRQVLFIARGSSDNAAVYGQYLCSARAGRLASLASPSLATAYRAVLDLRGVLAVAVSQSGATEEIVTTLEWARRCGARTVAVTNVAGSPSPRSPTSPSSPRPARSSPSPRPRPTPPSWPRWPSSPCPSRRVSGAEPRWRRDRGGGAARARVGVEAGALRGVPGAVAAMLEVAPAAEALAERLVEVGTLVVSGRGYAYSTALEVALKLKETCYLTAVGLSYADLVHGPIAVVDHDTPALLVAAGDGPILPEMTGLARRIAGTGADVYGIGGDQEFVAACRSALPGPRCPSTWPRSR